MNKLSLDTADYHFEIFEAESKRQVLEVCSQSRFDLMISNRQLPDGVPEDLVKVLNGSLSVAL